MRRSLFAVLVVVLLVLVTGMAASAGVSLIPTFIFAVRDGKVETQYLARFVGSQSGELTPSGNVIRPLPGEEVTCQALQVHAGIRLNDFHFQFARVGLPQRGDWVPFTCDETFGYVGDLGTFTLGSNGLATPLRFRLEVRKGESHELRIFGFKEPITNGIMNLLGMSHKDLVEYAALYVAPCEAGSAGSSIQQTGQPQAVSDSDEINRNFDEIKAAVVTLNANDQKLAEEQNANNQRDDQQDARLARLEEWVNAMATSQEPVATQALASPADPSRFSWTLAGLPARVVQIEIVGGPAPKQWSCQGPNVAFNGALLGKYFIRVDNSAWRALELNGPATIGWNSLQEVR